jgi:hypothetical protein
MITSFIIRYPGWQARVQYVVYRGQFHCEVHATFSEQRVVAISPFLDRVTGSLCEGCSRQLLVNTWRQGWSNPVRSL